MSDPVEHYYLRKPELPHVTRTSRFIGCHIKFATTSDGKPMSIWVVDSWGNESYLPTEQLGKPYDAWLVSDLLLGHMKKATAKQYVNARIRAMKGR